VLRGRVKKKPRAGRYILEVLADRFRAIESSIVLLIVPLKEVVRRRFGL
jgi:hypothetical protein